MTTRIQIQVAVAITLGISAAPAVVQANSNLVKQWPSANGDLETIGQELLVVSAGHNLELRVGEVTNPTAYPRVILDVFNYPSGTLKVEGASTGPGPGGNASAVVVGDSANDIKVWVVVRKKYADPPRQQSSVPLSASNDGGASWVSVGQYSLLGQDRIFPEGGLEEGTVVTTVQEPAGVGGASDTVLMELEDDKAIAFDDDMGIQRMSRLTLLQACGTAGHTCSILAARRSNSLGDRSCPSPAFPATAFPATSGTTTVVWDEDVLNGHDADGDGLGDSLEVALQTSSSTTLVRDPHGNDVLEGRDTDNDGIQDGWEVLGIYDFSDSVQKDFCKKNVLNFPYYGADPKLQDIFTQVSWMAACFNPEPSKCGNRTAEQYKDGFQWTVEDAVSYVMTYAPDFRAHVDIGPVQMDDGTAMPDTYDYGNWGGVARLPDTIQSVEGDPIYDRCGFSEEDAKEYHPARLTFCQGFGNPVMDVANHKCKGTDSPRYGYFNHIVDAAPQGCGGYNAGLCSVMGRVGYIAAHETGHYFGIGHGGYQRNTCKPNYMSMMGYCIDKLDFRGAGGGFPAFSHGWLLDSAAGGEGTRTVVLNPARLDERAGIGTTFPRGFDFLWEINKCFRDKVDTDPTSETYGAIDWDDDGQFAEAGTLVQTNLSRGVGGPNEAWRGGAGIAGADALSFPDFDTIAIYPSGGNEFGFLARYAQWDASANKTMLGRLMPSRKAVCPGDNCLELQPFPGPQTEKRVKSMAAVTGLPATDLVAFQGDDGSLSFTGEVNGVDASGVLRRAYSGTPAMVRAPMGSFSNGQAVMKVYAGAHIPVLGGAPVSELRAQDIDLSTGRQINGGWMQPQFFENGDMVYIRDDSGIGVTEGYVRDESGTARQEIIAAIPDWGKWTISGAQPIIRLAILEQTLDSGNGIVVDMWNRAFAVSDPFANIGIESRTTGPGRVGVAYRPDDPADPTVGRFYVTWQNPVYDKGEFKRYAPAVSVSRGNVVRYDSSCSTARSLCFPSYGHIPEGDPSWIEGLSLAYAKGHVRGMLGAKNKGGDNNYFPHLDGIIDEDQRDFNDYRHVRKNIGCALTQCPTLNDYSL
jgi:hypothetical protein